MAGKKSIAGSGEKSREMRGDWLSEINEENTKKQTEPWETWA